MKPHVLVIELGIKEIDKIKKKLNPKNAEIIYASTFLNVIDLILYENIHIILLSDIRGVKSTANYVNLFKKKDSNYKVIVISINDKVDDKTKKFYLEKNTENIFSYCQINEIQKFINKTAKLISKEDYFLNDWNKCTRLAIKFIRNNYHIKNQFFEKMQKEIHFSKSMIYYSLKTNTDKTIGDWIDYYKIKGSIQLLKSTNLNINKIQKIIGYKSTNGFIKLFKKHTGYSPAKYRKAFL